MTAKALAEWGTFAAGADGDRALGIPAVLALCGRLVTCLTCGLVLLDDGADCDSCNGGVWEEEPRC
jgi:hypothetical protein